MVWKAESSDKGTNKQKTCFDLDENFINKPELVSESNAHEMSESSWLVKCSLPALDTTRKMPILWLFLTAFEKNHKKYIMSGQDIYDNCICKKKLNFTLTHIL